MIPSTSEPSSGLNPSCDVGSSPPSFFDNEIEVLSISEPIQLDTSHGTAKLDSLFEEYIPPASESQQESQFLPLEPVEENLPSSHDDELDDLSQTKASSTLSPNLSISSKKQESCLTTLSSLEHESSTNQATASITVPHPLSVVSSQSPVTSPPVRRLESVASASVDHDGFVAAAKQLASEAKRKRKEERKRSSKPFSSNSATESLTEGSSRPNSSQNSDDGRMEPIDQSDEIQTNYIELSSEHPLRTETNNEGDSENEAVTHSVKKRRISKELPSASKESIQAEVMALFTNSQGDQNGQCLLENCLEPSESIVESSTINEERRRLRRSTRRSKIASPLETPTGSRESDVENDEGWWIEASKQNVASSRQETTSCSSSSDEEYRTRRKKRKRKKAEKHTKVKKKNNEVIGETSHNKKTSPAITRSKSRASSKGSLTPMINANTRRSTAPSTKKPKTYNGCSNDNDLERQDPLTLTIWELVVRNKRIVTQEELEARKAEKAKQLREQEEAKAAIDSVNDDFSDLFNDSSIGTSLTNNSNKKPGDDVDLFGASDPLLSNTGASLSLDAHGNFLLEDQTTHNTNSGNNDPLSSKFDGQQIVAENYQEMQTVKPFAGAYKYTKGLKWPPEDEAIFFKAISTFGLDLMMVKALLPSYSYRQIRDKYRLEERKGNGKIENALRERIPITTEEFEAVHGPINNELHYRSAFGDTDDSDLEHSGKSKCQALTSSKSTAVASSDYNGFFESDVITENNDIFNPLEISSDNNTSRNTNNKEDNSLAALLGI